MRRLASVIIILGVLLAAGPAGAWVPNDPYYYYQWNMTQIGMETAWDYQMGGRPDVKVAVIDSGVDWNLSDFSSTYFDYYYAWDYVDWDNDPSNVVDGHGTHVAGTIAQSTGNGIGVAGVAFNTTILPIRAGDGSYSWEVLADAVDYAVMAGADVINLSLGGFGFNDLFWAACVRAYNAGVLVIAAAGNDNLPYINDPASFNTVIAVGAVDHLGYIAEYSNYGTEYMIMAPGGDIGYYGTYEAGILQQMPDGDYHFLQGTSMAAPHVSGLAALIIAEAYDLGLPIPWSGPERVHWVADVLSYSTMDLGAPGQDPVYGVGMIRADWAMELLQDMYYYGNSEALTYAYQQGAGFEAFMRYYANRNNPYYSIDMLVDYNKVYASDKNI